MGWDFCKINPNEFSMQPARAGDIRNDPELDLAEAGPIPENPGRPPGKWR